MNTSTKKKETHRHKEQAGGCRVGGGAGLEQEFSRCKHGALADANYHTRDGWTTGPTVQHSNCGRYPVISRDGKEYKQECCYCCC